MADSLYEKLVKFFDSERGFDMGSEYLADNCVEIFEKHLADRHNLRPEEKFVVDI